MSGYPEDQGHHGPVQYVDDGYGNAGHHQQQGQEGYYQEDQNQGYYEGYENGNGHQQQHQGGDGAYYDES